jgi:hypothetical protein
VERLEERRRVESFGADLDPRGEAVLRVVPVRVVADGDVQPAPAGQQRVGGIAALGLIGPGDRRWR